MATDLGKVGMRMRGDWSSSTAYEVLDAVSYNGGLYIAKQAVPANTTPANTTYWQVALDPNVLKSIFNPIVRMEIAGDTPTAEELNAASFTGGVYTVFFYNSSNTALARSAMSVCMTSAAYGGGFIYGYYNNSHYKAKCNNKSWTITAL